jgi:hypothetical protein
MPRDRRRVTIWFLADASGYHLVPRLKNDKEEVREIRRIRGGKNTQNPSTHACNVRKTTPHGFHLAMEIPGEIAIFIKSDAKSDAIDFLTSQLEQLRSLSKK